MNRSYLVGFLPLLCITSTQLNAADWEKAHNHLSTFFGVQNNDNLFNTSQQMVSDQRLNAGLQWDWLGLFEGFGVQWPLSVERMYYLDTDDLDNTAYKLQPELRLFLSQQTDLAIKANLTKQQYLAGDGAAEFLSQTDRALTETQQGVQSTVSFGRAPDIQNIQLTLGTELRRQSVQDQSISRLDSDFATLNYSHKFNENIAFVFDASRRQEQQNLLASDINLYGAGISVKWTGQQFFRLTAGRFDRQFALEQLDETSGSYWQLNNLWQLDARWQLELQSGRRSVLSYSAQSISQLDTEHSARLGWQFDQSHQFSAFVSQLTSRLDQTNYRRTRNAVGASWQWQWAQQWQSMLNLSKVEQTFAQNPDRDRLEVAAQVSWTW